MAKTATSWRPGQSGNPAGRPKGARSKLSEVVLEEVFADFQAHGAEAVRRVREQSPEKYLTLVASLVPKEVEGRFHVGNSIVDVLATFSETRETEEEEPRHH